MKMKPTGNDIVSLLLTAMTDIRMIEMIDALGLEQPVIDEQYEMDLDVSTKFDDNTEVIFTFEEIDGHSKNGEPCLSEVDFIHGKTVESPFGLSFDDDYKGCCSKLGKTADFNHALAKKVKIWLIESKNQLTYSVAINFKDKELNTMRSIVVTVFDRKAANEGLLENKE